MGLWNTAASMAAQTPEDRNRYVDFLRALSILFVISGHWLIATAYFADGQLTVGDMLEIEPGTQWLTWLFQVMPIFFAVGGYSNAVSLEGAKRRGIAYGEWLSGRLHRLVSPLFLLLCAWGLLALTLNVLGTSPEIARAASQASLIPTWFLAVYILVVALAPVTYRLWQRWGYVSFIVSALLAAAMDAAYFLSRFDWLAWSNYFWIWLAVHQLGYAWRDGRIAKPPLLLAGAAVSAVTLWAMVKFGPYPVAMAGSPDEAISNTLPPKIPLLALGLTQFCLLLAVEKPVQRWLAKLNPWTGTVLINSMIMTVYLWHMTVMVIVISVAYLLGGFGIGFEPGTEAWWWTRPVWLGTLTAVLIPLALLLSFTERLPPPKNSGKKGTLRLIVSAILICAGVATLAFMGFDGDLRQTADLGALIAVTLGVWLSGLMPFRSK